MRRQGSLSQSLCDTLITETVQQAWRTFVGSSGANSSKRGASEAEQHLPPLREAVQHMYCTCADHAEAALEFPPPTVVCRQVCLPILPPSLLQSKPWFACLIPVGACSCLLHVCGNVYTLNPYVRPARKAKARMLPQWLSLVYPAVQDTSGSRGCLPAACASPKGAVLLAARSCIGMAACCGCTTPALCEHSDAAGGMMSTHSHTSFDELLCAEVPLWCRRGKWMQETLESPWEVREESDWHRLCPLYDPLCGR